MLSLHNSRCARNPRRTDRGSAVITVLILAAVTAVIASGFLFRSAQEAKLATRSFFQSAALNLAEAGIEEGLYAANTSSINSANGWSLIGGSTTDYQKTITTGLDYAMATGAIYIRADNATSNTPAITAAGVITIPNQRSIVKQLRVAGNGLRHIFSNTVVTKGNLTFAGSAEVDAYDSSLGPYNTATNRNDRATVASSATVQLTGSAEIYGSVATSGTAPVVGGSGRIYGATSPASPLVDTSRVRTDFNTNLPDANTPTGTTISLGTLSSSITLPRVSDVPGANGRYLYSATDINLNGSNTLTINGPVDLISVGDAMVSGNAQIVINNIVTASLNLYSPATISLKGNGMINNTTNPAKVTIWGTKPSSGNQTAEFGGSSAFYGTIYIPNGEIAIDGAAGVFGAVIGKTVTLSGSSAVHYDIKLSETDFSGGPTPGTLGTIAVSTWSELTDGSTSGSAFARDTRTPFANLFN